MTEQTLFEIKLLTLQMSRRVVQQLPLDRMQAHHQPQSVTMVCWIQGEAIGKEYRHQPHVLCVQDHHTFLSIAEYGYFSRDRTDIIINGIRVPFAAIL